MTKQLLVMRVSGPEYSDAVDIAVVEIDRALARHLAGMIRNFARRKETDKDLHCEQRFDYAPTFVPEADLLGPDVDEENNDELYYDGYMLVDAPPDGKWSKNRLRVDYCILEVYVDYVRWVAHEKHTDAEFRTYKLSLGALEEFAKEL